MRCKQMVQYQYESEEQEEIFEYLDELRKSGRINMLEAVPFITDNFDLATKDARNYLIQWITTYSERN